MFIVYNIIQIFALVLLFPILIIYIGAKEKYRSRIAGRLGFNLIRPAPQWPKKRIWIHALSVGEVTSAYPLIFRLLERVNDIEIYFSASTKTGCQLARSLMAQKQVTLIPFPLDIYPVTQFFLRRIRPDLFILVETDFWPNLLNGLKRKNIPVLLVNGRISDASLQSYLRFSVVSRPLFSCFSHLCVQTDSDKERFTSLGVSPMRISKLGNLKYDTPPTPDAHGTLAAVKNWQGPVIVAGSTHPGEEEIILQAMKKLIGSHNARLIIAPRDPARDKEVKSLVQSYNLKADLRTETTEAANEVYILNTIGELASYYSVAQICFVGGSLVKQGGHNPIEAAMYGKPVLFGPHMEDFEEVSEDLLLCGGGFRIHSADQFYHCCTMLLEDTTKRNTSGQAARDAIMNNRGVLDRHINLIRELC